MKKRMTALILSMLIMTSFFPVYAAENISRAGITDWEQSYWKKDADTVLTEGANGVNLAQDRVKSGSGSAKLFLEKKTQGLEAALVQGVSVETGKYYRFSGSLYYHADSAKAFYGIYMGGKRLEYIGNLVSKDQWCEFERVFRYGYDQNDTLSDSYEPIISIKMTGQGFIYADDLSLTEVNEAGEDIGAAELLKNGGFEKDFEPPEEVTELTAEGMDSSVTLRWKLPEQVGAVKIYRDSTLLDTIGNTSTEYFLDGLENGTEYTFTVTTVNYAGAESKGVSIKAIPHPPYQLPDVIKDDENNRIVGISEEMEYSFDKQNWISYDPNNPPVLDGTVTVYVRIKSAYESVSAPIQTLYFTENGNTQGDFVLERVKILENTLYADGKLKNPISEKITLLAVRDQKDRRSYDDILCISQVNSDENGAFHFEVPIADERKGQLNDGSYTVYLDGEDRDGTKTEGVIFVSAANRVSAIEELLSSENPVSVITGTRKEAFSALGIYTEDFERFASESTNSVLKKQFEGISVSDEDISQKLRKAAELSILITAPERANAEEMLTVLMHCANAGELSYEGIPASETIEKGGAMLAQICSYMAGKKQNTLDEAQKNYCGGAALYDINNAAYGAIKTIIEKNKTYLNLESDAYRNYMALTGTRADDAAKYLVQSKNKNQFTSGADILKAMSEALNKTASNNSGGGGSGGSSSSKGSKGESLTVGQPTSTEQRDENVLFKDLEDASWAKEAIMKLYNRKIVSGYGDKSFAPNRQITREEYTKILVSAFNIGESSEELHFADVEKNQWFYSYIASAFSNGIVGGISEDMFGTGQNISREDIAVMTYRCLEKAGVEFSAQESSFQDQDEISEYAKKAVAAMKHKGIISGYEDGSFGPKKTATRAEACRICALALEVLEGRTL